MLESLISRISLSLLSCFFYYKAYSQIYQNYQFITFLIQFLRLGIYYIKFWIILLIGMKDFFILVFIGLTGFTGFTGNISYTITFFGLPLGFFSTYMIVLLFSSLFFPFSFDYFSNIRIDKSLSQLFVDLLTQSSSYGQIFKMYLVYFNVYQSFDVSILQFYSLLQNQNFYIQQNAQSLQCFLSQIIMIKIAVTLLVFIRIEHIIIILFKNYLITLFEFKENMIVDPSGRYKVEYDEYDKIGEGAFSYVYKGLLYYQDNKKINVAVKILKQSILDEKYMLRQLQMLSKVQHPNIIKFYQCAKINQRTYYITELCSESLEERMIQKKIKNENDWVVIYKSMIDALHYLHFSSQQNKDQAITHRDIKPSNILFNQKKQVKLCDFGLARIMLREEMNLFNSTKIGTINYMSPEIICDEPYNSKCDMWSLGVVMYELIEGIPLISKQGSNNKGILRKEIKKVESKIEKIKFTKFKYPELWKQVLTNLLKCRQSERWNVIMAKQSNQLSKVIKCMENQHLFKTQSHKDTLKPLKTNNK